jgi:hypothetical protein
MRHILLSPDGKQTRPHSLGKPTVPRFSYSVIKCLYFTTSWDRQPTDRYVADDPKPSIYINLLSLNDVASISGIFRVDIAAKWRVVQVQRYLSR